MEEFAITILASQAENMSELEGLIKLKFLVRIFSAKPDFTELDKEIEKEQKLYIAKRDEENVVLILCSS